MTIRTPNQMLRSGIFAALLLLTFVAGRADYIFSTLAGTAGETGYVDAQGASARFVNPIGTTVAPDGTIYIADSANHIIRRITPDGTVSTFAGLVGQMGNADGTGSEARFSYPWGLTTDTAGNVYVCDAGNHTLRKITPTGQVNTLAGLPGDAGYADGVGPAARFNRPSSIAYDRTSGDLFVTDYSNTVIRRVTMAGSVTTFAGTPGAWGAVDGEAHSARFNYPDGIAINDQGVIFVSDSNNHAIRKITPDGMVSTFVGSLLKSGNSDGTGSGARFDTPTGIVAGRNGILFVADSHNYTIRKIYPNGLVATIGGVAGESGSADGGRGTSRFFRPEGIALDPDGNLVVADTFNQTIRHGVSGINLAHADFNDNQGSDILAQNPQTGEKVVFVMNDTSISETVSLGFHPGWTVATGDFDRDGQADILWNNPDTGEVGIWFMDRTYVGGWISLGFHLGWIVNTGDFNSDGYSDILWNNPTTGELGYWLMEGSRVLGWTGLGFHPGWKVRTGDFNGDGYSDILWNHPDTGEVGVWTLVNGVVHGWTGLGYHPGWTVSSGDFNGDGYSDIVWYNPSTGELGLWLLEDLQVRGWIGLGNHPGLEVRN